MRAGVSGAPLSDGGAGTAVTDQGTDRESGGGGSPSGSRTSPTLLGSERKRSGAATNSGSDMIGRGTPQQQQHHHHQQDPQQQQQQRQQHHHQHQQQQHHHQHQQQHQQQHQRQKQQRQQRAARSSRGDAAESIASSRARRTVAPPARFGQASEGTRKQLPMNPVDAGIPNAKTYYPSEEEFRDPLRYIELIQSEGERHGIVKIVPPHGWNPPQESPEKLSRKLFSTKQQRIDQLSKAGASGNIRIAPPYAKAFLQTAFEETIEATVRTRRLCSEGFAMPVEGSRFPKRVLLGTGDGVSERPRSDWVSYLGEDLVALGMEDEKKWARVGEEHPGAGGMGRKIEDGVARFMRESHMREAAAFAKRRLARAGEATETEPAPVRP
eukprot:g10922.t1